MRAPWPMLAFVPGLAFGAMLLVVALVWSGRGLGAALFFAGASYVAATAAAGSGTDARAPLVAGLLILCGELSAWSFDARLRIRAERQVAWRRGAAVAVLTFAGLAVATLLVALTAVGPNHGLGWTVLGAAAALGAAGTGIWVAHR